MDRLSYTAVIGAVPRAPGAARRVRVPERGPLDDLTDGFELAAGALPLLQFVAARLWDARDRQAHLLTMAACAAMGGISGAIAAHADQVVADLTPAAGARSSSRCSCSSPGASRPTPSARPAIQLASP